MSVEIRLDRSRVEPGSTISGKVVLLSSGDEARRKIELSVLWETEGKGDTDMGVLLNQVIEDPVQGAEQGFEQQLPLLPVSYSGRLLKVRWLVRVRGLRAFGRDEVVEEEFFVGWET